MGRKFLGKLYTGDNKEDFLPPLDVDPFVCTEEEYKSAVIRQKWIQKCEIRREQKHLKAFLKGKEDYMDGHSVEKIDGITIKRPNVYQVLYEEVEDED